jgi:hypothetical protein
MVEKRLQWDSDHHEYIKNHTEVPEILAQYKRLLQNDYNKKNLFDLTESIESNLMFESLLS